MTLDEYLKKRDFKTTPEPGGEVEWKDDDSRYSRIFVVQRHDATHLHYDLRLSMDGVLRSWAVPKTPPVKKGEKRLAIRTEDHPIAYADFEGNIPEGEYGAGSVRIWDRGTYDMEDRKDTKMVFTLKGKRLDGRYVLLKFPKAGDDAWLFMKV